MVDHVCRICQASFKNLGCLRGHVTTSHPDIQYYKCDICNKAYKHYSGLHKHKKTHASRTPTTKKRDNVNALDSDYGRARDQETPQPQKPSVSIQSPDPASLSNTHPMTSGAPSTNQNNTFTKPGPSANESVFPSLYPDTPEQTMSSICTEKVFTNTDLEPPREHVSTTKSKRPIQHINEPSSQSGKKVCLDDSSDRSTVLKGGSSDENNGFEGFRSWCRIQTEFDIGESYAQNIITFVRNHAIPWNAGRCEIMDYLDTWNDQMLQKNAQLSSIANGYRYALYFAHYKGIQTDILDDLNERVRFNQQLSTRQIFQCGALDMLDPAHLNHVRNEVITALNHQQRTVIDPFIRRTLQFPQNVSKESLVLFGCEELRCFIEVALRFCNVPSRMQVTQYLVTPDTKKTKYVAKLVVGRRQYMRLIYQDKVGKVTHPVRIPCGPVISMYLFFYLRYCRPDSTNTEYVFVTKTGALWRDATKCVKAYFSSRLKLDITNLDKSGRIVHGARRVCLATYALRCNFNEEKLQHMACLMRHSLETARTYYNPWVNLHRGRAAAHVFAEVMDLPDKSDMAIECLESTQFVQLGRMDTVVYRILVDAFGSHYEDGPTATTRRLQPVVVQFRDNSTQTTTSKQYVSRPQDTNKTSGLSMVPPTWIAEYCDIHTDTKHSLHGPCGNSRHAFFGHYFAQCLKCFPKKRITATSKILPLGWTPPKHVVSKSSRPRNMVEIEEYIRTGQRPSRKTC